LERVVLVELLKRLLLEMATMEIMAETPFLTAIQLQVAQVG
jgi:hypothetical protein